VPVEHRWAGLDRRTLIPAAGVLLVALLWAIILPAINGAIKPDQPVRPGTVLAAGRDVSFTPAVDWQILAGLPASQAGKGLEQSQAAQVAQGATILTVFSLRWAGSLPALLDRVVQVNSLTIRTAWQLAGARTSVETDQGVTGISEPFVTGDGPGQVAAFLRRGTAVVAVTTSSSQEIGTAQQPVGQMIASIRITP
jgi:hypothetical protein